MDGVGRAINKMVFELMKSNKTIINTAEEFATETSNALPSI